MIRIASISLRLNIGVISRQVSRYRTIGSSKNQVPKKAKLEELSRFSAIPQ